MIFYFYLFSSELLKFLHRHLIDFSIFPFFVPSVLVIQHSADAVSDAGLGLAQKFLQGHGFQTVAPQHIVTVLLGKSFGQIRD